MKPERHALLLTILRSPEIQVARLQLATAEVVALIKADKVSLLMDVYRIAREEEKMREAGVDVDTPMKVGVSTLDGWSEIDQSVTADRAGSPLDDEADVSTKRKAAGMSRSASASSTMKSNKRRASALDLSSSSLAVNKGDTTLDATRRASSNWMMQEATQNSMKKAVSNTLAAAAAAAVSTPYGNHSQQQDLEQNYGLITPLTANSQLMDPQFLQATKESNDGLIAGYMSAPPPSHAQLFPHSNFQYPNTHQPSHHHQYNLHPARDASNMFAFHQQQQQRMDSNAVVGNSNSSSSALGLQGIGMHWSNAGFGQDFSNDSNAWWQQQQHQQQQQQQQQQQPSSQQQTQPPRDAPTSLGDSSFENSFTSTVDSAGPATPPLSAGTAIHRDGAGISKDGSSTGPAGAGTLDYVQHLRFSAQDSQQQLQHQQSSTSSLGQTQQINRNPYNLSLGKVPNSYDSWSFPAQTQ
jgi:hypothetical protein